MRSLLSCAFAAFVALPVAAQDLANEQDKQSYSVGVQLGKLIEDGKDSLNLGMVLNGLADVIEGKELQLSEEETAAAFREWQQAARKKQEEEMSAEGEAFLKANAERDEVVVLDSGLQYEVLREGAGATPTRSDTVKAHYKGTLIDGTEFDSSYKRGQPFETAVTRVIPGWTEALLNMKEGAKWKLYIPHELAYGARGAGAAVPPYATLIFEMELLEIVDTPAQ